MSNRIIKINRGDSFSFDLDVLDTNNKPLIKTANEAIYFALLYPHQQFEDAIFIKGYDINDIAYNKIIIKLTPNDTRNLTPGIYYYTVKYQKGGTLDTINDFDEPEEVKTIIERTKFIINE